MLISRELGKELKVDIKQRDPKIPPGGYIQGIDLVTEGIITISHALERMRRVCSQQELIGEDEATQLAKALLASDKVTFLVGRAINPAHQNPSLPMNMALKLQIVKGMESLLKERGKDVRVQYF